MNSVEKVAARIAEIDAAPLPMAQRLAAAAVLPMVRAELPNDPAELDGMLDQVAGMLLRTRSDDYNGPVLVPHAVLVELFAGWHAYLTEYASPIGPESAAVATGWCSGTELSTALRDTLDTLYES